MKPQNAPFVAAFRLWLDCVSGAEGLARIPIIDSTGEQPTLYLFERPSKNGHVIWFGSKGRAFALTQEHLFEALPFLSSFLETGCLFKG